MNDMPTIAPMGNEPNENSSLDELATYALHKQDQIFARDKMNGEDLWLMGQALEWAKGKVPHGQWEKWWKANGLKKTYVWQARKLHEVAPLEDVKELGLTEALLQFGVVAEKKEKTVPDAKPKKANDESPAADEGNGSETTEQDQDDGEEPAPDEPPADALADEEEKELKEYQEAIRKLTPKTRAVAIHHALEMLRDELDRDDVDQELQQTLGQIVQLVAEIRGLSLHVEAA